MKIAGLIVGCLLLAATALAQSPELREANERLRTSLKTLDALIIAGPKAGPVYEIYSQIRPELAANRVQFVIDDKVKGVIDGISIEPDTSQTRLRIGLGIIALDRASPGFLLGYLCEGFSFLRAVIRSPQRPYSPDSIQKIYDSMDALFLHAVFLRDYVLANGKQAHPFERYLVESLQNDSLSNLAPMSGAAMYLLSLDAQVLYSFSELGGDAQKGALKPADYLQKLIKLVGRLKDALTSAHQTIGTTTTTAQLEARYISEVSALTMLSYGVAIVNAHLARFYPKAEAQQTRELTDLNQALDSLSEAANSHTTSLSYRDTFLKKLGL